jgi:hypothetical protein
MPNEQTTTQKPAWPVPPAEHGCRWYHWFRAFAKRLVNVTADEIKIREALQSTERDKPPLPNE